MTRKDYGSGDAVTEDQLRDMLRSRIGWHGGKRVFAKDLADLSDVLNNRRGIADKLANALGYQRVVIFRKSDAPQSLQEQPSC
jgi:hypothetical protein